MSSSFSENVGIEDDNSKEFEEIIIINFENGKNCSSLSGIGETAGMEIITQARPWQVKRLKPSQNLLNYSQNQRLMREKQLSKIRSNGAESFQTDIFQEDKPTLISSHLLINLQEHHDYNRTMTKHFLMMWFSFDSLAMSSALSTAVYNATERALMEIYFDPEISVTSPQQSLHFSGPTANASGIFTHQGLDAILRHFEGVSVFRSSLGLHSIPPVERLMLSVNIDVSTFESVNDNIQCIFCVQTHNAVLCGGNLEFSFVGMVTGVFRESKLVSADIYFNAQEVQTKYERCFGASAAVLSRHLSNTTDIKDSSDKKSVSFVTKGAADVGDISLADDVVSLSVVDNCSLEPSGAEAHKRSSLIQLRSGDIIRKVLERTALLQPVAVTVRDATAWCQSSAQLIGGLFPHGAQGHEHDSCLVEVYPQTDAVSGVLTSLLWRVTLLPEGRAAETGCAMSADTLHKLMDKCVECMSQVSSAPLPVVYDPRCPCGDNHLKECESAAAVVRVQSSIASYQLEAKKKLEIGRRSTVAVVNRVLSLVSAINRLATTACSCAANGITGHTKDVQIPSAVALITPGASKKSLVLLTTETETDNAQTISDGTAARRVRVVSESPLETHETILDSNQAHREFGPLTQQEPSEYFYCDPANDSVVAATESLDERVVRDLEEASAAQELRDESEIREPRNGKHGVLGGLQQTVAEFFHAMRVSGLLVPLAKHMGTLSAVTNSAELVLLGRLVALTEGLHSDPQIRQWMQRAEAENTSREEEFQLLSDVQRKDKSFAEAFHRRASLLHAVHCDVQSFADLHEALKLSPTHCGAMLGKAHLYLKTLDFRSALVMFSAAVGHNPALLTVSLQEAVNRCHTELNREEA